MNGPIINPWLLYFIESIDKIQLLFFGFFILFFCIGLIHFLCAIDPKESNPQEGYFKKHKKGAIKWGVMALITLILTVSIPSKDTCYKMLIANYVTYENVEVLGDSAKDTVDYIFDKIEEVQNGTTESEGE